MKLPLLLTLSVIALAAVIGVLTVQPEPTFNTVDVQTVGRNAFGDLSLATPTAPASTETKQGGDTSSSDGRVAVLPVDNMFVQYNYVGQAFQLPSDWTVLRRTSRLDEGTVATALTAGGLLQFSSFNALRPQYVTLTEGDQGMSVNIDYDQGTIHLYRQYAGDLKVMEIDRGAAPSVSPDEIDKAALIASARAFLEKYGIQTTGYGEPVVREDWRLASGALMPFSVLATDVMVVFPWQTDNRTVLDESGLPYGLQVSLNARTKEVQGVQNITTLSFESARYDLETDAAAIQAIAERGGVWGSTPPPGTKVTTIELDTPTLAYTISRYQLAQNSEEFLVPTLVFPVKSIPKGTTAYVPRAVVVPLVKQLLQQATPGAVIRGSTGSAGTATEPAAPAVDLDTQQ